MAGGTDEYKDAGDGQENASAIGGTDIRMPPSGTDEGIAAAVELRHRRPEIGVLVLSQHDDPSYALALLEAGSEGRGYLLKDRLATPAQVGAAIRQVAKGGWSSALVFKIVALVIEDPDDRGDDIGIAVILAATVVAWVVIYFRSARHATAS